jgi:hypothetical protein
MPLALSLWHYPDHQVRTTESDVRLTLLTFRAVHTRTQRLPAVANVDTTPSSIFGAVRILGDSLRDTMRFTC